MKEFKIALLDILAIIVVLLIVSLIAMYLDIPSFFAYPFAVLGFVPRKILDKFDSKVDDRLSRIKDFNKYAISASILGIFAIPLFFILLGFSANLLFSGRIDESLLQKDNLVIQDSSDAVTLVMNEKHADFKGHKSVSYSTHEIFDKDDIVFIKVKVEYDWSRKYILVNANTGKIEG